jgi:hypothetical protein
MLLWHFVGHMQLMHGLPNQVQCNWTIPRVAAEKLLKILLLVFHVKEISAKEQFVL